MVLSQDSEYTKREKLKIELLSKNSSNPLFDFIGILGQ
jgi:hypothetical protein